MIIFHYMLINFRLENDEALSQLAVEDGVKVFAFIEAVSQIAGR